MRSEARRVQALRTFANMPDNSPPPRPEADWDRLRPVLDQALDRLPARDRDIILLRFFQGLSFSQLGAQLSMNENAARMRAMRALEKLRRVLHGRGVSSTTAALALVLSESAIASTPAGLAAAVSASALSSVPAAMGVGIIPLLIMSKLTLPLVTAAVVAGILTTAWHQTVHAAQTAELTRIERDGTRLTQLAIADDASARLTAIAQELAKQNAAKIAAAESKPRRDVLDTAAPTDGGAGFVTAGGRRESPRGHHWSGQATPLDASKSFAWANDSTDVESLAKLIWFDPALRVRAQEMLATMPPSLQAQYPTPEKFYAFVLAADALLYPPPTPEVVSGMQAVMETDERAALRRPGSSKNFQEYQKTNDGWKFVMPAVGVERWPANLNNELLVKLSHR